jgi:hypothetical protein
MPAPCAAIGGSAFRLRTLLAGEQRPNLRDQFCRDGHERDVLALARRLDVGELLILGLVFVVRDELLDALLIPSGGEFLLAHFDFLRCRRRKALLALACSS